LLVPAYIAVNNPGEEQNMIAKYILGIDLGTTNTVLACASLDTDEPQIEVFAVPQLVAAGTVEARPSLSSFAYLPTDGERSGANYDLLWEQSTDVVVGEMARRQAAEVPDRTVGGAKSWLAHSKIDRHQPVLPWGAPAEVPKISPVTASRRYLEHLVAAWEHAHPDAPVHEQRVVLTVPASFDASARELTREAALAAGLPNHLILLEEPQAAVYAWLVARGDRWRKELGVGDRLLVCDVGGGTTDLTLVAVTEDQGEFVLQRIAVGNHLLVGGDNMDLALAHHVADRFDELGHQLDPWQSVALWHSCRTAKEILLGTDAPQQHTISVLGRGSKLVGAAVSVEVDRGSILDLLTDGFFPRCGLREKPAARRASGFREIGLPFESDTGITRHVAAFLAAHGEPDQPVQPSHLLLNGGVFQADTLQRRLVDVFADWFGEDAIRLVADEHDLDYAVACGAAYYGWAKEMGGIRIRGGTARSYYIGIETAGLAIPGTPRPLRGLCVVPFGMEEGTQTDVPSDEIGLVVGEPATFRFFSSATRKEDKPGDLIPRIDAADLEETDSLEAALPADDAIEASYLPVKFESRITELGMFELWCVSTQTDGRWKLEFSVREDAEG